MEEIYIKYSRLVYNYLYRLTNNVELSEELTQETFYSAIKGIKNFKNKSNISVWLCQIAKNEWRDYLKKSKKITTVSIDDNLEHINTEDNIEDSLITKEEKINFYKKVHKLYSNTKEVIYLRINCEFSFKEIANILGKSEEWTRITFHRGKIKLKEEFNNEKRV